MIISITMTITESVNSMKIDTFFFSTMTVRPKYLFHQKAETPEASRVELDVWNAAHFFILVIYYAEVSVEVQMLMLIFAMAKRCTRCIFNLSSYVHVIHRRRAVLMPPSFA